MTHVSLLSDYRPHAAQVLFHRSSARIKALNAGRRGGKTHAAAREFCYRVFGVDLPRARRESPPWVAPAKLTVETKPLLHYWCVAPTYTLGAYQRREIFDILGGPDSPMVLKWNRADATLWCVGGVLIEFKSANNPLRLVGAGLHGMWIDEAARVKAGTWDDNLYPTLSDKQGWSIMSSTPMGKNWFYEDVWQRTQWGTEPDLVDEQYSGHHFRTVDNTAVPALVEEARLAKKRLPDHVYRRNYEPDFDAFEGKIYPEFVDGPEHIFDGSAPDGDHVAGVDWGFRNPGCQLCAVKDAEGVIWVYSEDYAAEMNLFVQGRDCWVERFKRARDQFGVTRWVADPSSPEHINTCMGHGLYFMGANNTVTEGIDVVGSMLKPTITDGGLLMPPRLRIHRSCVNLRREMGGYKWKPGIDAPVKVDDHACDALRYLVMELTDGYALSPIIGTTRGRRSKRRR